MSLTTVTLVGHPFAPIGMGEVLRSTFRSLRAVGITTRILDAYATNEPDPETRAELLPHLTDRVGDGTNIFCINGNEVAPVLSHLAARAEGGRRRIIQPAWELPDYPAEWASQLERFDEVWGFSSFTAGSIRRAVRIPVHTLPLATEVRRVRPLGRRAFGIPEAPYVFLFFFDLTSFIERKNPFAALEAFRYVTRARPGRDLRFVVKLNSSRAKPDDRARFLEFLRPFGDQVVLLDRSMDDAEVKALHLCADAFVSLHRAEGYGFGLAEAMFLGRPVVATGWSGNMDFMTPETGFLVSHSMVSVPPDAYPHPAGQFWAEANVEEAAEAMIRLADDHALGHEVGARASRHIRTFFSHRAIGLRAASLLTAGRE